MSARSAILFDLDGTLLDTARDFHGIINRMLQQAGQPAISYDSLRTQVSNGARAMVCHAFNIGMDTPGFSELHQQLLDEYAGTHYPESRAFEGMNALLDWLDSHQHPWGIVTNKPERFTRPLLQQVGWGHCPCIICPEQVQQTKPDPEGLLLACRQLGAEPAKSIYVGDHVRDIEAGRAAGMITVAAAWGYLNEGERCDDWHSDHICEHPEALHPLLQSLL
ncbi:HAD-IA family hydrolase [Marinobacterium sp. AK62]|uniref:HAD-IA family hydrolase n=1 Tax=Marinobacterium alkalitolerans TaxID=1542925 RepID=A0ABS3ZAU6_9GAMM|nr:HAD-IA family hydrolase [Marinobacterium alkalitolerans]MBP0048480.1 HAD-IA family hydrolase [Marinobacterium alkalitolerans]